MTEVRMRDLTAVVRAARSQAEGVGMDVATADEWIAITLKHEFNLTYITPEQRLLRAIESLED